MTQICFECGNLAEYQHHVIPRSKGGLKTIPLCGVCHGKAHFWDKRMSSGELTKAALAVKKERGEKTGGKVPFGFDVVEGKLIPNHHEQEAIRTMQDLKGRGLSLRDIGAELIERGFFPKGRNEWYPKAISQILEAQS